MDFLLFVTTLPYPIYGPELTRLHCKIDADEQNYLLIIDDIQNYKVHQISPQREMVKLKNLSDQGRVARAFSLDVRSQRLFTSSLNVHDYHLMPGTGINLNYAACQ